MSKIITGWTIGIKCKNGTNGMVLNYVDDAHIENGKDYGHLTGSQFMDYDEFNNGTIEVRGRLTVGAPVRIMKENVNGMDRVTFIDIGERKYKLFSPLFPEKASEKEAKK